MSSATWVNYGIGVCTSDLQIKSLAAVKELVALSPRLEKEIADYFMDCEIDMPEIDDYLEYDQDCCNGIAYLLRQVMIDAEDLKFTACDDYDGRRYIMYQPSFPWDMSDEEKSLSKDTVAGIITKYVSVITDDHFDIVDISAENYG